MKIKYGFTVIETLIVIVIIMMLAAIAVPGYYKAKEKCNAEKEEKKKIEQAKQNGLSVIKDYCPKCGSNMIDVRYIKEYDKEYLNISCKRCQYAWKTICFDAFKDNKKCESYK